MISNNRRLISIVILWFFLPPLIPDQAFGQEPSPPEQKLQNVFPKKAPYSPYAGRGFPTRVYWGDTHLHTALSMDAGAAGCRLMQRVDLRLG